MQTLPIELSSEGYEFKQLKREKNVALYSQREHDWIENAQIYVVIIINAQEQKEWTYFTLREAQLKMLRLLNKDAGHEGSKQKLARWKKKVK
jgi:hypothetical protein